MLNKDVFRARRFRIWVIGLLIVVVSVSIVFVHVARQPSESFVSVTVSPRDEFGALGIQVSNKCGST